MEGLYSNYIFFLQFGEKLPIFYFELSQRFARYGISLVPILPKDLPKVIDSNREYVLSVNYSMTTAGNFRRFKKSFLNYALLNKKVTLFDVSSFEKHPESYKYEPNENYHYYAMPVEKDYICKRIAAHYYHDMTKSRRWPGGRRAKLPGHVG